VLLALDKIWHIEHFLCAYCKRQLGTDIFYEDDGLPYCEMDYQELFLPKCADCHGAIVDVSITVLQWSMCGHTDDHGAESKGTAPSVFICGYMYVYLTANKPQTIETRVTKYDVHDGLEHSSVAKIFGSSKSQIENGPAWTWCCSVIVSVTV